MWTVVCCRNSPSAAVCVIFGRPRPSVLWPVVVVVVFLRRFWALAPPQTPLCGMILEVKASSQWTINDPTATDFSEYQGVHRRVLRPSQLF